MTRTSKPQGAAEAAANAKLAAAPADEVDGWQRASQVATVGLFVLALLWCAYVGRPILVPLVLAWVIATIILPVVKWFDARGVPRVVAAIAVTLTLALIIFFLVILLSTPLSIWLGRANEIGAMLQEKLKLMSQPLAALEEIRKTLSTIGAGAGSTLKVEAQSETMVSTIFSVVTPAVGQFVLCIGALIFYLVYRQRLRNALVYFLHDREARLATLRALNDIDEQMTTYFGTFTLVNIGLGVATTLLAWAVGLPNPLLWGALAAVLNYVPYLGPAVVCAALGLGGLLSFPTVAEAVVAPAAFLAIVSVEGQFITPALMGRQLELNPFAVFLAIAFCTWLWGPVGAFVAVPLLIALRVTLNEAFAEEKPDLPG